MNFGHRTCMCVCEPVSVNKFETFSISGGGTACRRKSDRMRLVVEKPLKIIRFDRVFLSASRLPDFTISYTIAIGFLHRNFYFWSFRKIREFEEQSIPDFVWGRSLVLQSGAMEYYLAMHIAYTITMYSIFHMPHQVEDLNQTLRSVCLRLLLVLTH